MYTAFIWNIFGCDEYLGLTKYKDYSLRLDTVSVRVTCRFYKTTET